MIDIDLDAIRQRDRDWRPDGHRSMRNQASADRHELLRYIDELESLAVEIESDVSRLRSVIADLVPKAESPDKLVP